MSLYMHALVRLLYIADTQGSLGRFRVLPTFRAPCKGICCVFVCVSCDAGARTYFGLKTLVSLERALISHSTTRGCWRPLTKSVGGRKTLDAWEHRIRQTSLVLVPQTQTKFTCHQLVGRLFETPNTREVLYLGSVNPRYWHRQQNRSVGVNGRVAEERRNTVSNPPVLHKPTLSLTIFLIS